MAKKSKRLADRYGADKTFRELMDDIVDASTANIQEKVLERQEDEYSKTWERNSLRNRKGRSLVLPDIAEVLPKEGERFEQSKATGKGIADTLQNRVLQTMRSTLEEFSRSGEGESFVRTTGRTARQINPKLFEKFKENLKASTAEYTKKNPSTGLTPKVEEIATSTLRQTILEAKKDYALNIMALNPDAVVTKTWNHNPSQSKEPRKGHAQQDKKTLPIYETYLVNHYVKKGGRYVKVGTDPMDQPHDPFAPIHQKANCHCDVTYKIRIK